MKKRLLVILALEATLVVGRPPRADSIQHAALGSALNSTGVTSGFFAGTMDEARIWNYARTGAEIVASAKRRCWMLVTVSVPSAPDLSRTVAVTGPPPARKVTM